MHSRSLLLLLRICGFAVSLLVAAPAWTQVPTQTGVTKYRGMHPVSPHQGRFCYIDLPHVHRVPPPDMRVYRVTGNQEHIFVGDPVALGYTGPKHAYAGAHLLAMPSAPDLAKAYCYLEKPHYHAYVPAPNAAAAFALKDGVYWPIGEPGPELDQERHLTWINQVQPIASYAPPKVDMANPPPGHRAIDPTNNAGSATNAAAPAGATAAASAAGVGAKRRTKGKMK